MIKREANFGQTFRSWIKSQPLYFPNGAVFELKQTTTNSIPFSDVQDHQIDALVASELNHNGLLYKIPDDSRGIKPYDMVYLRKTNAYIVIKYPKCFSVIPVMSFIEETSKSKRKSLTSERARDISYVTVSL